MINVMFVCTNNICRSPTAHGVFETMAADNGLAGVIHTDSAATHGNMIGDPPDRRAQAVAAKRGYDLSRLRARRATWRDLADFDYVLGMDEFHRKHLAVLCNGAYQQRIRLLMEFGGEGSPREVPDPYYGPPIGFERVLDLVEDACAGLLDAIRRRYSLQGQNSAGGLKRPPALGINYPTMFRTSSAPR